MTLHRSPDDVDEVWASFERRLGSQQAFLGLRETADLGGLAARARRALAWIGRRPEREIVVVSHQAFLTHLTHFGHEGASEVSEGEG